MALPQGYAERVYAGVLGKIIGVYLGRPFEGWTYERIMQELGEIEYYVHERLDKPLIVVDDDISGTFCFLRAMPDHGATVHGREGRPGPRSRGEIGVHALRGGTVTGEHTVYLFLPNERVELTHRAEERTIFTRGALWAARKIAALPPGRYAMRDLLE